MLVFNLIGNYDIIDIVIFVLIFFVLIFLIFLTSSLMKKNKELRSELTKVNDGKIINEDVMPINDMVQPNPPEVVDDLLEDANILLNELEIKKEEEITDILGELPEIEETGPYKKNVLRELSRGQTSPVNIGNVTVEMPKIKVTSYAKQEESVENNNVNNNEKSINDMDNQSFVEEISRRMEDELKPQTIDLTDYERKQEEEAIISYQELLQAKDRMYRITDDEEIDTFIDELKEFRTNLK